MSTAIINEIATWIGDSSTNAPGLRGVIAVSPSGTARERRRVARTLGQTVRARHLTATDDENWMRSALQAVRDLELGTSLIVELSNKIPTRFLQFLRDLRSVGAVEVLLPSATRSTTIRCRPNATIIVMMAREILEALPTSGPHRPHFDRVVQL